MAFLDSRDINFRPKEQQCVSKDRLVSGFLLAISINYNDVLFFSSRGDADMRNEFFAIGA